jgi:FkbM family methyltransferase
MKSICERPHWLPPAYVLQQRPDLRFRNPRIIDLAMAFHTGPRRLAIQAGGHLGSWPAKLSGLFEQVVSLEPVLENWQVCVASIQTANVRMIYGALGAHEGLAHIATVAKRFSGSARVTKKTGAVVVPCYRVDALPQVRREEVDALFLDVEGYELEVLHGAERTLRQAHPLVVVEENSCGLTYGVHPGDIGRWLGRWGYREAARYGRDVVYSVAESAWKPREEQRVSISKSLQVGHG